MIKISENTTWNEFQRCLNEGFNHPSQIILDNPPKRNFAERIVASIYGNNPVALKVYQLILEKIRDQIIQNTGVTYGNLESYALKAAADQIMEEAQVSFRGLNHSVEVKKVWDKIDEKIILAVSSASFDLKMSDENSPAAKAENIVKALMGGQLNLDMVTMDLVRAVLVEKDHSFMAGFQQGLNGVLEQIWEKLQATPNDPFLEILIGAVLSLYPFCEPEKGTRLNVPRKIKDEWKLVEFEINMLNLTPDSPSPIPAYALTPFNKTKPILIFRGTPQPSASGSLHATLSDIIPGYSVGEYIYEKSAKDIIQNWVNEAFKDFEKVDLFGTSLGGSLSLITMAWQPDKIGEVRIYGPASLQGHAMAIYEKHIEKLEDRPKVYVYWNKGDSVPFVGEGFHKDWNLYKLITTAVQDPISAHASLLAARPKTILIKMDPEVDSKSIYRRIFNLFYKIICVVLLPLTITLYALSILKYKFQKCYTERDSKSESLDHVKAPEVEQLQIV